MVDPTGMRRHHGPIDPTLESRRLYIEHLAQRLEQMELGIAPMKSIAYRLFARRLRQAMAGFPEAQLIATLSRKSSAVSDALAMRFFDVHGWLPTPEGQAVRDLADLLLAPMRRPA
jgi:hypothetical protein